MRNSSRWVPAYVVVLLVAAGILGTLNQGDAAPIQAKLASSERDTLPNIVGTWTGTWEDTIFTWAHGDLDWVITQNDQTLSGTGTIGMSVFGMGLGDQPGTATGTISARPPGSMISFTFEGTNVGSGSGSIVAGGAASGTGTVGDPLFFGDFTFQGTVTSNTIRGTFDFVAGGAGKAMLTKTTPVEPTSWGAIKSHFRDSE